MKRLYLDSLFIVAGWLSLALNLGLAVSLRNAHARLDRISQEFIQANQHFTRWQKTADHLLQENGYEPITPLLQDHK